MFFASKANYKASPKFMTYPATQTVYKMQLQTPPTVSDSSLVEYVKPVWKSTATKVDFQQLIDKQKVNLITPEKVEKIGFQLDPTNVVYQSVPLGNLNATDVIDASKVIASGYINKEAQALANNDIKNMQAQQNLDAKITNLKTQLDILQQQKAKGEK